MPPGLFAPPADRRWTTRDRRLRRGELAAGARFPVYAPPPHLGVLRFRFGVLQDQRGPSAGGLPRAERQRLYLGYVRGGERDPYARVPFQLVQRARTAHDDRWFRALRRGGKLTVLTVDGRRREALVGEGRSQRIALLLPGTAITGWSELERRETLALLRGLERIGRTRA